MTGPRFPYCGREHEAPREGAPALETRTVGARYAASLPAALQEVSISVATGERVALVGPNGAGKSTLLKVAAGLMRPSRGEVRVLGHAPECCYDRVAYLPQSADVDWRFPMDVFKFVLTGRYVHLGWFRWPRALDRERTTEALERMGVAELAERQIGQLSGGQRQRVLIARALAQEASLNLFDEPATAVDRQTRLELDGVLEQLRSEGRTAIVATHDLDGFRGDFDRAIFLDEGRVVEPRTDGIGMHAHGGHE